MKNLIKIVGIKMEEKMLNYKDINSNTISINIWKKNYKLIKKIQHAS